jgi:type IV pilus assembly protein PilC
MPKNKTPFDGETPPARSLLGEGGIVGAFKSLVPFLFKPSKPAKAAPAKALAKPEAVKKVSKVKTGKKKAHSAKKRTVRSAIPALEISKVPKSPVEDVEHDDLEVQDASTGPAPKLGSVRERSEKRAQEAAAKTTQADVIDEAEEEWMTKVLHKRSVLPDKKESAWSMFKHMMPFGGAAKGDAFLDRTTKAELPSVKEQKLSSKDLENDPFLKKITAKNEMVMPMGEVASKKEVKELEKKMTQQEDLAKKREEAFQKELERQNKEITQTKASGKDDRAAVAMETRKDALKADAKMPEAGKIKPAEEKKPEEKKAIVKHAVNKVPTGMQAFTAAIGHIGLGKERTMFIQNLGTMLGAGLSLVDSLHTLQKEVRAKPMRKIIQQIIDAVENGYPLWRAMEQQSFFSPHALALVRIGEEAGNLAENVVYLAQQEEKDHALRGKVKMAMIYPSIVMVLMFIIVVGLGMFVLPQLLGVLTSLNVPLPLATRMIILFTNLFTKYGAIFVPSSIGVAVFFTLLSKFTRFKVITQWIMFRIPGIGALAREATIARFGVILGGLLKAGVPVVEAMQSLVQVTPIVSYKNLYAKMLEHILVGDSFAKSFQLIKHSERLLPPSVQQLVITGERSGALADITLKVADIYDKKASDTAQKLPVILEPMLLLFIGALVGTIAFAIIVPIYSIVGNVGNQ